MADSALQRQDSLTFNDCDFFDSSSRFTNNLPSLPSVGSGIITPRPRLNQQSPSFGPSFSRKTEFDIAYITSGPLVQEGEGDKLVTIPELRLSEEREKFEECIKEYEEAHEDAVVRFSHFNGTSDSLREVFTLESLVVHYSGHGESDCLMLEDEKQIGFTERLTTASLSKLIGTNDETSIKLVVLSACHSESVAETFHQCGIPHIVAIRQPQTLEESDAHNFLRHFYLALLRSRTIEQAFNIGIARISTNKQRQNFILLPQEKDYHNVVVFPDEHFINQKPFLKREKIIPVVNFPRPDNMLNVFLGRNEEMFRIIDSIKNKAITSVVGDRGMGKTVLLSKVCEYLSVRRTFKGFYYFDFSQMPEKYVQSPWRFIEKRMVSLGLLDHFPKRSLEKFYCDLNGWMRSRQNQGPGIPSQKHYCIFVFDSLFESGPNKDKRPNGNFKVRAQRFLLDMIKHCQQLKILVGATEKPNCLRRVHHSHKIQGLEPETIAQVFLQTVPKRLWEKSLGFCRQTPLQKLMSMKIFTHIFDSGLDGRPSIIQDLYERMEQTGKNLDELTVRKDYPRIVDKYDRDNGGGYWDELDGDPMPHGPGIVGEVDSAKRIRKLTKMYDHLIRVLYDTQVFEEIWRTIQVRVTPRFIPQFIQELHPFLVENAKGPNKTVFQDHGIFKPNDVEQMTQEWSQNHSTMSNDIYHKFVKEFDKTLGVVLALGNHYWNHDKGVFWGHVDRNSSTDQIKRCLREFRVQDSEGICLLRFSSKKGAIAIDRVSRDKTKSFHLLVYIYLQHEKPFCWNSNSQSIFPFSTLRDLLDYISTRYVDISYIFTCGRKLLPVKDLDI